MVSLIHSKQKITNSIKGTSQLRAFREEFMAIKNQDYQENRQTMEIKNK